MWPFMNDGSSRLRGYALLLALNVGLASRCRGVFDARRRGCSRAIPIRSSCVATFARACDA
jgi:hypothetical protein